MRYEIEVIETNIGVIEVGGANSEEEAREAVDKAYERGYTIWNGGHIYYGNITKIGDE